MKSFLVGLQFLTRLRLDTQTEWKDEDFGKSVAWFPVIGWIIGLLLCGVFFLIRPLGSPLFDWIYFGYIGTFYYRGIIA